MFPSRSQTGNGLIVPQYLHRFLATLANMVLAAMSADLVQRCPDEYLFYLLSPVHSGHFLHDWPRPDRQFRIIPARD